MRLLGILIGLSLTAALAIASPAEASTCSYVGGAHAVVISLGGPEDTTTISRSAGGRILDGSTPCPSNASVTNTSVIYVRDTTPSKNGNNFVGIDLSGGPLAPGYGSAGPYGVPEIKIELYLEGGTNFVYVTGGGGPDNIHLGTVVSSNDEHLTAINLNAGPESDPSKVADADVIFEPAHPRNDKANEILQVDGDTGDDTIDASGGPGFDGALAVDTTLFGGPGNDRLTGGAGTDLLYADPGDDVLDGGNGIDQLTYQSSPNGVSLDFGNPGPQDTGAFGKDQLSHLEVIQGSAYDDIVTGNDAPNGFLGGGGNDLFTGRGGDDGFDGGPGTDTVSYRLPPAGATKGVNVDLSASDIQQNTVGAGRDTILDVENLWGSPFADDLKGDGGPNSIAGFEGKDSVNGNAGDDELAIRDGEADQATCGTGVDRVVADVKGTDSVFSDCETVDFAPFVAPPPGSDPGTSPPPGIDPGTTPPPGTASDTVVPVLDQLTLSPSSFTTVKRRRNSLRAPGTEIAYRLSEAASVTFRVERCARVLRGGCLRWNKVRGSFAHGGLPGVNRMHFDGRLRHKRLAPARYRLVAVAVDGAGNRSARQLKRFRILR